MKSTRTPILRSQVLSPLTSGIVSLRLSHSPVIQRCEMRLSGSSIVCPLSSPLRKEVIPVKRVYEKPALYIERFMLTQTIASGCDHEDVSRAHYSSPETCGWEEFPGFILFMNYDNCNNPTQSFDFVCYNGPTPGQVIFAAS